MGLIDVLFLATALTGPQSAGSIEEDWAAFDGAVRVEVRNPQPLTTTLPCIIEVRLTNVTPRVELPFADRKHDELTPNEQRIRGERASTLPYMLSNDLRVPASGLLSDHELAVTVEIAIDGGTKVFSHRAVSKAPFYSRMPMDVYYPPRVGVGRPHLTLKSGETRSLFVDLSPWTHELLPGKYELTVRLHSGPGRPNGWTSAPFKLRIQEMPTGAAQRLAGVIPDVPRPNQSTPGPVWVDRSIEMKHLRQELPEEVFSQLAPYLFLNAAARVGKVAVALAPVDLLDAFPPHLEPLADTLRYEVLRALGDKDAAAQLRRRLIQRDPGIEWQLGRVDRGDGLIQQAIRRLDAAAPGATKEGDVQMRLAPRSSARVPIL